MNGMNPINNHSVLQNLSADDHPQYHPEGMRFFPGNYFNGNRTRSGPGTFTLTKDRLYFFPFRIGVAATFDRMSISVNTAVAASNVYFSVYLDDGSESKPSLLLTSLFSVNTATTGIKEIIFGSTVLAFTTIWLAIASDSMGVILDSQGKTDITATLGASAPGAENATYLYYDGTAGTWISPITGLTSASDQSWCAYLKAV